MPELLIERLQKLQHQRGYVSPFATHTEFLAWADSVLPLLSFNSVLQNGFKSAVLASNVNISPEGVLSNINRAIGILNQAVTQLETAPLIEQVKIVPLEAPEKMTLKWLYEHAPWSFYGWLFAACTASFSLGFTASEIKTAIHSKPLSEAAPTLIKPTNASPAITKPITPKSIASAPQ